MHKICREYLENIKTQFPKYFDKSYVLDVGSVDINGHFRDLFTNCHYIGIDIWSGKNVDLVCNINDYTPGVLFDTIFSIEMLEHDVRRSDSLKKMYSLLKPNGLLVCTAAGISRREHGTHERGPKDSPATLDYYRNIDSQDILSVFPDAVIDELEDRRDIRFYVIKK